MSMYINPSFEIKTLFSSRGCRLTIDGLQRSGSAGSVLAVRNAGFGRW